MRAELNRERGVCVCFNPDPGAFRRRVHLAKRVKIINGGAAVPTNCIFAKNGSGIVHNPSCNAGVRDGFIL